ncbi:MAG: S8 family serine peptidase, partial [Bacteroidia bacterium]|nr:S8 family serine peptidase [Bacteroidia bacterium]
MKNISAFVLAFLVSATCFAQLQKLNTGLMKVVKDESNFPNVYTVLVKGDCGKMFAAQKNYGVKINYVYGNIASVTGSLANLVFLSNTSMVTRMELQENQKLQALNDTMRKKNYINPIQSGQAPLAQAYDGKNVIMGLIDSGIDFNAPDFLDSLGRSRILYIWDQNYPVAANTPQPFNYGQEWDSVAFNANTCPHTDMAYSGHGTHTAGIAAATGGAGGRFRGVAPKADIIMVGLDFNSYGPTIADAANYIFRKADSLGRPCVINASVGDYYGSHDGKDLQTQIIDSMLLAKPGRLFVAAAGNYSYYPFHVGYTLSTDTNFTWISNNQPQINFQFYADAAGFSTAKYSIGVNDPNNLTYEGNIGFKNFNYALGVVTTDSIYYGGNRIGMVNIFADTAMGVYTLDMLITPDSLSYAWRFEATGNTRVDGWNFDFLDAASAPPVGSYPSVIYNKAADTLMTMVSGPQ